MILGDSNTEIVPSTALHTMLSRTAARWPDAIALVDPPNRESFTDGAPQRLTYAETDHIVSAIAWRLRNLGLQTDAIVGIQLPNTVESVLTILGVMRAGMIAAPLPLLWRQADAAAALGELGCKAIITTSRIGDHDACATAMQVAADLFPIRYVCSFGLNLPDGVIAFDDLLDRAASELPPEIEPYIAGHGSNAAAHVALVTFDVTPDGIVPVARNHAELIAGGLAPLLEGGIEQGAHLLACCATGSFAGLALAVMPWLLSGGTLLLHHGFAADAFATQCHEHRCDSVVVPGALVPLLAEAGLLAYPELTNVLAVWRAPERHPSSPDWQHPTAKLTDMLVFGETALIGSRRGDDGRPTALPAPTVTAPSGSPHAVPLARIGRTAAGTLAVRGPMVPRHAFPSGAERLGSPHLKANAEGFVDTLYACRIDSAAATVTVTAPPPGIITVGAYRFRQAEIETLVRRAVGAFVTALPDALAGHRLAGIASDSADARAALNELGVNPLLAEAFSDRLPARSTVDYALMPDT